MHALRTRIAQRQRKEDTRRKIFPHTMVHPRNGERLNAWIRRQLPGFISERDQTSLMPPISTSTGMGQRRPG